MRGRPGCPTGQEKNSVGATGGSPRFLLLQGKVGYQIAPSSAPVCALGHLPPEGKALRCASLPVRETTPPSPPSWGAGRYGRWIMGRRPGKKEGGPPQGPPKPEKVGPGRKNLFLPGVLSSGFLPKKAGPPPGAGRATGRCALRPRNSPDHPTGTQYPTAPRPGPGGNPPRRLSPAAVPPGTTYRPRQRPPAPPTGSLGAGPEAPHHARRPTPAGPPRRCVTCHNPSL